MKKYKAQKIVEHLLINSMIQKNCKYVITYKSSTYNNDTYEVHNLKAKIEDGSIWFSDERLGFVIEDIIDVEFKESVINIILNDNINISINLIK